MAQVSIGPTQSHYAASIGEIQESANPESTGVDINTIMDTHRRRLELSVEVLVVRDFGVGTTVSMVDLQLRRRFSHVCNGS